MNKIRVLVISRLYPKSISPYSGIFVHNQVKALIRTGCQVRVISPIPYAPKILWTKPKWKAYGQIAKYDVVEEVPVYYPRYLSAPGKWDHGLSCYTIYYSARKIVNSIIKGFKPHIIHAYTATPDGYVGLLLKKKYNIPFVCSLRGSDINLYPAYGRLPMSLTQKVIIEANQVTSVSSALKRVAEFITKPKREIRVVYNGCDLKTFSYDEKSRRQYRDRLGIPLKGIVIIFVGHLLKSKGVLELIHAFVQLNSKYSNLYLIFVGDGPAGSSIRDIVSFKGLKKQVHLVGGCSQNGVSKWLNAADIFALPTYYEGLPNAVLEAMACGLPVVASRVGGIPEAIEDGKSGILVKERDVNFLAKALAELIENVNKSQKMGLYGREIIKRKFSWEQSAGDIRKIYEKIIKQS